MIWKIKPNRQLGSEDFLPFVIGHWSLLWMTLFYPWPPGVGELLYGLRLIFGSGMMLSILLLGPPDEFTRALLMAAGWLINLAVAEWIIHRQLVSPRRTAAVAVSLVWVC
jgi:hypothetical protein